MKPKSVTTLSIFALALTGLVSTASAGIFSSSNARVLIDSWAHPDFTAARETDSGPKEMTYHVYKGRHFGGYVKDKSLTKVTFDDIVKTLAPDFQDAKLVPAPTREEGDMLIVIHWGVTGVQESWTELMGEDFGENGPELKEEEDSGDLDFDAIADAQYEQSLRNQSNRSTEFGDGLNAELTGIQKALSKPNLTVSEEIELRSLLRAERYFIILMAFDWQKLQTEKKYHKLWSTRFSLDAGGVNFVEAYPALSRAAAPYLATDLSNLTKNKTHLGPGKVTTSELEILGEVTNTEAEPEKKK